MRFRCNLLATLERSAFIFRAKAYCRTNVSCEVAVESYDMKELHFHEECFLLTPTALSETSNKRFKWAAPIAHIQAVPELWCVHMQKLFGACKNLAILAVLQVAVREFLTLFIISLLRGELVFYLLCEESYEYFRITYVRGRAGCDAHIACTLTELRLR